MPEAISISVALGTAQTGLSLKAQLVDEDGVASGSPVTDGFVEMGNGNYYWSYEFPDNFRGGVIFKKLDNTVMAFATINPTKLSTIENIEIEQNLNLKQALQVIASALAGLLSGAGTSEITIKAANNDETTRITATCDVNGNRTEVTLYPS